MKPLLDSPHSPARRKFLHDAAVATAASLLPRFAIGQPGLSANSKLNVALIGAGGRGKALLNLLVDENVVAFCDVNDDQAAETYVKYPEVPRFKDFREMFDRMGSKIDAVCVATPDHTHFVATYAAMALGKHVLTEKPLTHNIWQARTLRKAAKHFEVVTAMGNQGHSQEGIRLLKEWYEAGVVGEAQEVLLYNKGPQFEAGSHYVLPTRMPPTSQSVPTAMNWNLWKGPLTGDIKYNEAYTPKTWRGFYQFGNGQLGDWGCHSLDGPYWALGLGIPNVIEVLHREKSRPEMVPRRSVVRYEFPRAGREPLKVTWHEGVLPEIDPSYGISEKHWDWGVRSVILGEDGALCANGYSNGPRLYPEAKWQAFLPNRPPEVYPRNKGSHVDEWLNAIKGEGPTPGSNFEYAGQLTETVLLGAMAQRTNQRIEWDAAAMQVTNAPELNAFVKEPVRRGWEAGEELWT